MNTAVIERVLDVLEHLTNVVQQVNSQVNLLADRVSRLERKL